MTLSKWIKKIKKVTSFRIRNIHPAPSYPVILPSYPGFAPKRGRVLFSYLERTLLTPESAPEFNGHSNLWESREIARIFQELGYQIEAINWRDDKYIPSGHYDIVFDIFSNLGRFAPYLDAQTLKILHCTGSDPYYQNAAEQRRVEAANMRRNGHHKPQRYIKHPEQNYKSLQVADICSLIGSTHTLNTYPPSFRDKMVRVTVSASQLGYTSKKRDQFVPQKREFLWFFGGGAIHKGLDLLLEVFARNPQLVLNVVGDVLSEKDFIDTYKRELFHLPNIRYHGYLIISTEQFQKISQNTFCFIAPTCSEGISPAVATCLQIGLYPIISRDTGVNLPNGYGLYLEDCSIDEIERAVMDIYNLPESELSRQISFTQDYALRNFSRENFHEKMKQFITHALDQHETY